MKSFDDDDDVGDDGDGDGYVMVLLLMMSPILLPAPALKTMPLAPTPLRIPFGKLDKALRARDRLIETLVPRVLDARESEPSGLVGQMAHYRDGDGQPMDARRIVEHLHNLARFCFRRLAVLYSGILGQAVLGLAHWTVRSAQTIC